MASRKVDQLGRIVIPQDIREKLQVLPDVTYMDIELKGNKIVLSKSKPVCLVCGRAENMIGDMQVCESCAKKIAEAYKE